MKYIALLRGINVGGHNVKMDQLKKIFSDLGLNNVSSYINSGNIFFESDNENKQGLTKLVEPALETGLGFSVPTFLRTESELTEIIEKSPFKDEPKDDERFTVVFLKQPIETKVSLPLSSNKSDMEVIGLNKTEAYVIWHIISGRPPSGKFDESLIPKENTTRFFHTLKKIYTFSSK